MHRETTPAETPGPVHRYVYPLGAHRLNRAPSATFWGPLIAHCALARVARAAQASAMAARPSIARRAGRRMGAAKRFIVGPPGPSPLGHARFGIGPKQNEDRDSWTRKPLPTTWRWDGGRWGCAVDPSNSYISGDRPTLRSNGSRSFHPEPPLERVGIGPGFVVAWDEPRRLLKLLPGMQGISATDQISRQLQPQFSLSNRSLGHFRRSQGLTDQAADSAPVPPGQKE